MCWSLTRSCMRSVSESNGATSLLNQRFPDHMLKTEKDRLLHSPSLKNKTGNISRTTLQLNVTSWQLMPRNGQVSSFPLFLSFRLNTNSFSINIAMSKEKPTFPFWRLLLVRGENCRKDELYVPGGVPTSKCVGRICISTKSLILTGRNTDFNRSSRVT